MTKFLSAFMSPPAEASSPSSNTPLTPWRWKNWILGLSIAKHAVRQCGSAAVRQVSKYKPSTAVPRTAVACSRGPYYDAFPIINPRQNRSVFIGI